jgi:hypothetical protein
LEGKPKGQINPHPPTGGILVKLLTFFFSIFELLTAPAFLFYFLILENKIRFYLSYQNVPM